MAPQWRTERRLFAAVTQHSGIELRLKAAELSAPSACTHINSTHYKEHTGPDRPPVYSSFYYHGKSRSVAVHSILLHLLSLFPSAVLMGFRSIRYRRCKPQTTCFFCTYGGYTLHTTMNQYVFFVFSSLVRSSENRY